MNGHDSSNAAIRHIPTYVRLGGGPPRRVRGATSNAAMSMNYPEIVSASRESPMRYVMEPPYDDGCPVSSFEGMPASDQQS